MKEHVIINRDRTVVVPESLKKIGIQFDHNVNTITFDCPRYPDEDSSIDMSQMPIFINYMLPDKTPGSSLALNVTVDETDNTLMHFDWKITNAITPVNGVLSTLICVKQSDTEGNELYHWNTDLFQKFTVGNGMECNGQVAEMNPDVITQLLARMGEVDTRTSAEAMSGYVNEYMTENPPQPTDEQVGSGVNAYMTSNGQTHVNAYMTENQELVQNSVDDYLGRNPLQLDDSLIDSTKAAPADKVGELKSDITEIQGSVFTQSIEPIETEIINGFYMDGKFYSNENTRCYKAYVYGLSKVRINGKMNDGYDTYDFVDSNGNTISYEKTVGYPVINADYVVPDGAVYVVSSNQPRNGIITFGKYVNVSKFDNLDELISNTSSGLCLPIEFNETTSKILNYDGQIIDIANDEFRASEMIDITNAKKIMVTGYMYGGFGHYALYDSAGSLLSIRLSSSDGEKIIRESVEIPANAKYLCVSSKGKGHVFVSYSNQVFDKYKGVKWSVIGDSISDNKNETAFMRYYDYIADELGFNINIMGEGGTGYKNREDGGYAFYQRVLNIPSDTNVCTVFGSINDLGLPLGTYTDTGTDTICGCVNTFIDNYYTICPTAPIGIISPTPAGNYLPSNDNNAMALYTEELRKIAKARSIPFLDLYHCSNLRPWDETNRNLCFSSASLDGYGDGVHPNELGHKIIATKIREFLLTLI